MAIAFVNGATGGNNSAGSTFNITYTITVGNSAALSIFGGGGITSITDSSGTGSWTFGQVPTAPPSNDNYFAYKIGSAVFTSITVSMAGLTNLVAFALGEYSGVNGVVGGLTANSSAVPTSPVSLSTAGITNDWFVVGGVASISSGGAVTVNTGNLRETSATFTQAGVSVIAYLIDNTSSGTNTVTVNVSSAPKQTQMIGGLFSVTPVAALLPSLFHFGKGMG